MHVHNNHKYRTNCFNIFNLYLKLLHAVDLLMKSTYYCTKHSRIEINTQCNKKNTDIINSDTLKIGESYSSERLDSFPEAQAQIHRQQSGETAHSNNQRFTNCSHFTSLWRTSTQEARHETLELLGVASINQTIYRWKKNDAHTILLNKALECTVVVTKLVQALRINLFLIINVLGLFKKICSIPNKRLVSFCLFGKCNGDFHVNQRRIIISVRPEVVLKS